MTSTTREPRILVVRGGTALAGPDGQLPSLSDVDCHMVIVDSYGHGDIIVVTASTGDMPSDDGFKWVGINDLQRTSSEGELIGEAVLCGKPSSS